MINLKPLNGIERNELFNYRQNPSPEELSNENIERIQMLMLRSWLHGFKHKLRMKNKKAA